jgi:predicted MFS family arabinose efflux permease
MPQQAQERLATRRQASYVLGLYVLLNALNQFEWLRFAPITSRAATVYAVDIGWVGGLAMIFPLLTCLLSLPMGWAIDRFGLRPGIRVAALLMAAGTATRCLGGFQWIFAGQVLIALAQPLLTNSVNTMALLWFEGPARLRATGIATMSLFLGIALAFVIVPLLPENIATTLIGDAGVAGLLLAGALAMPRDPGHVAAHTESAGDVALLRHGRFLAILGVSVLGNGFFGAIFTWLERMLLPNGFDSETAGLAGLLLLIGGIVGSAVLPGFANSPTRRRPVVIGPALLAVPATVLLLSTSQRWLMLGAATTLGVCLLSPLPVLIDMVQRLGGAARAGFALSLFWLAGNLGSFAITWLLSFPAESGDWRAGGIALVVLLLVQAALAFIALAPAGLESESRMKSEG